MKQLKHGHTARGNGIARNPASPEYRAWASAKNRCNNPHGKDWHHYGGRGIKMCERWSKSFIAFLEDMGPRPKGTSLDRYPNQNGNYEPGNCRWATPSEQNLNSKHNHLITIGGVAKPVSVWSREYGINRLTLHRRISAHWPESLLLSKPEHKIRMK